jgi:uncharacterized protein YlxW (UPF0749 family)
MGTFAKIFIVVNLVLAVVFLGAASALLGEAESWKAKYETDKSELLEDANSNVKQALEDLRQKLKKATKERDDYEKDWNEEQKRADGLDRTIATQNTAYEGMAAKYNRVVEDFNVLSKTINDIKADNKAAWDENQKLRGQVDEALAAAAAAKQNSDELRDTLEREQAKTKQLSADLASAEKKNVALSEEKAKLDDVLAMVKERIGADALRELFVMKAVHGTVVGVDEELNIVLISVGTDDEVKIGYTFTVYRSGEYLGKLVIDKVGEDWASGHMDRGLTKEFPQRGDEVATQL